MPEIKIIKLDPPGHSHKKQHHFHEQSNSSMGLKYKWHLLVQKLNMIRVVLTSKEVSVVNGEVGFYSGTPMTRYRMTDQMMTMLERTMSPETTSAPSLAQMAYLSDVENVIKLKKL